MLKGKTIIELTNVNTGKKETYEDHNMITQAINEIILKRKRYLYPNDGGVGTWSETESSFYNMFPLYKSFFGGIMLFQNSIDESRMFISGDDVVIGSATVGNAYSGLDSQIGSYNQSESEINTEEKYAKFVYDFATNQGNGTISSVCLGNYHYVKHCLYGKNYSGDRTAHTGLEDLIFAQNGRYSVLGSSQSAKASQPQICLFPTMRQTDTWETKTGYETPVVYDEEKGHLITVQFTGAGGVPTYDSPVDSIKLNVYDLGLNKCTLFGGFIGDYYKAVESFLIYEKEFTIPTCGNYSVYNMKTNSSQFAYYDESDGCVYVLGDSKNTSARWWSANDVFTMFKFDLNAESYENITMDTIEITNKSGKQLNVATTWKSQNTGYRKILIKDGYLYAPVSGNDYLEMETVAKIKITDSTDVTLIDLKGDFNNQSNYNGLICDCGDMIFWGTTNSVNNTSGSDYVVKMINTKTNEVKYSRVKYGLTSPNGQHGKAIPIKGNNVYRLLFTNAQPSTYYRYQALTWCGVFASRNDYLATINNLDTPVTKTSDKTMKITYVLQGE